MRSNKDRTVIFTVFAGIAAAVIAGILFAAQAVAGEALEDEGYVSGLTADRAVGTTGVFLSVASAVLAAIAMNRAAKGIGDKGRRGAMVASAMAAAGLVISVLIVALADGGPGTGNGIVAGWIGIPVSLAGGFMAWRALTRAKAAE